MLHKAWNSKEEMPYCFPRTFIKFEGHTGQNITDFDPNWAFPDYRPVAAFKSLRFALFTQRVYLLQTDKLLTQNEWFAFNDKVRLNKVYVFYYVCEWRCVCVQRRIFHTCLKMLIVKPKSCTSVAYDLAKSDIRFTSKYIRLFHLSAT